MVSVAASLVVYTHQRTKTLNPTRRNLAFNSLTCQKIFNNNNNIMGFKVFYHVCAINHCLAVVKEQISALHLSGMYDAAESVHVFVTGNMDVLPPVVEFLHQAGRKIKVERVEPHDNSYERFTLLEMRKLINPSDVVFYFHTKGVSRPASQHPMHMCFEQWARMLLILSMRYFRIALEQLQSNQCDVAGVNYTTDSCIGAPPHFSGNFWFARGDYYLTLDPHIGSAYLDPEMYICTKQHRALCLYRTNRTHYLVPTSMREYVDVD